MRHDAIIRLGVVGLGRGFVLTLPALLNTAGLKMTAAFDIRPAARNDFCAAFGGVSYDSLPRLLEDPEIDAIYIASPHELHAEQSIAAARAGKHVLVEKPMAIRLVDCEAMVNAATATGTVLVVGPSHGFDAPVQRAAALLNSQKELGAVRLVTALNFTDFIYRPRRPEELDPLHGGGVVYSQAAHQFDVVRRLIGKPINQITAAAANWDRARNGDGAYTALVQFEGGAVATLTYSGYGHYDSDELMNWVSELGRSKDPTKYGEARRRLLGLSAHDEIEAKLSRTFGGASAPTSEPTPSNSEHFGFVLVSCEHADIKIMPDGLWIFGDERKEFCPVPAPDTPRSAAMVEFVEAIRGTRPATQDGVWGLATMACCEALIRSSALGRTVALSEIDSLLESGEGSSRGGVTTPHSFS